MDDSPQIWVEPLFAVFTIEPVKIVLFEFRPVLKNKLLGAIAVFYKIKGDLCSEREKGVPGIVGSDSICGK